MKPKFTLFDRREFLGIGSKIGMLATLLRSGGVSADTPPVNRNPFAYSAPKPELISPELLTHETVTEWSAPRRETKRVAVGPDGRIYLCAGNYVSVVTPEETLVLEFALPDLACCVAVAKDGQVFAATRNHIEVFDANGKRVAQWDSAGRKSWLTGLAVDDQQVFAADSGNRIILRYDRAGKLLGRWGEKDNGNAPGFVVPSPYLSVRFHPDGLLRVNNPGRHQVEAYTLEGSFEGAWGRPSAGLKDFCGCCNPIAMAVLPDGRIVTAEKGIPRVKVYAADGHFQSVAAGTESFVENAKACSDLNDCTRGGMDLAADAQGRIYLLDVVTNRVRVMKQKA